MQKNLRSKLLLKKRPIISYSLLTSLLILSSNVSDSYAYSTIASDKFLAFNNVSANVFSLDENLIALNSEPKKDRSGEKNNSPGNEDKKEKAENKNEEKAVTSENSQPDFSPVSLTNNDNQARFEGDNVDYDSDKDLFIIDGNANIYLDEQNIKISADRIEYERAESKLKAYGNVLVSGRDQMTFAKYMEIEIDRNRVSLDEVSTEVEMASINAQNGKLRTTKSRRYGDYQNGDFKIATPINLSASIPGLVSSRFLNAQTKDPNYVLKNGQSFTLSANKLSYYPDRIQNNLHIAGGSLKFKKFPIAIPIPYYVFTAGESTEQMFQAVVGTNPNTGAGDFNLGPKFSFVLGKPEKQRAISFAPFLQFGSAAGYGGLVQYRDKRNNALLAYGAAKDRGLAEVTSRLTKYNTFNYGWNSYVGGGITEQFVQVDDQRSFAIPGLSSILENEKVFLESDLTYIKDSDFLRAEENNLLSALQRDSVGTNSRRLGERDGLRAQQRLSLTTKPLVEIGTENYNAGIRINSSSTARIYTTGHVNAFTSVGPNVRMHLHKYADLSFGYNQLLAGGKSPFGFDQVIQGNESMYAHGDFNITDWLSVGGSLVYSLSRKNFVTQQARVIVGPEDFKLVAGYDPVRRRFNLGFSLFFNDKVSFKKFTYRENTNGRKRRF